MTNVRQWRKMTWRSARGLLARVVIGSAFSLFGLVASVSTERSGVRVGSGVRATPQAPVMRSSP